MHDYDLLELADRVKTLKTQGSEDCAEILRKELNTAPTQEAKLGICGMLGIELQSQGRSEEAEAVIRERISLSPDNPESWITLALHFFYYTNDIEKALSTINVAIQKASAQKHFFRQAHLERIRISLALNAYSAVEESLIQLIDYTPDPGRLDSRLESDFLVKIRPGTVDANLVERYKARLEQERRVQ